jgi:predicted enzyme related to lactoylglutathione lyase
MIKAVHNLIYSDDPVATRDFIRDVLGWPYVEDGGPEPGWLIFKTGPSELGVHPTGTGYDGQPTPSHHSVSLMCDNLEATMAELRAKGAQFSGGVIDRGYGLVTGLVLPGAGEIQLYEPRHAEAYHL